MKVYLLETGTHDFVVIVGVFKTVEGAKAAHPYGEWKEDADGSWSNGTAYDHDPQMMGTITPFELGE